jgi:thioredoxin 1
MPVGLGTLVGGGGIVAKENVLELNDLNFETSVLAVAGPVLVDFTAAWCGPCRALTPILERFAERTKNVVVASVDADACPDLASRYGVRALPTVIVFAGGREVTRRVGLTNDEGIRKLVAAAATHNDERPVTSPAQ